MNDERYAAFLRMDREGRTGREIASALGVTPRTVVRWRGKAGTARRRYPPRPESDHTAAARLIEDGCHIEEVARTLNVARATIVRWFPDAPRMPRDEICALAVAVNRDRRRAGLPRLKETHHAR